MPFKNTMYAHFSANIDFCQKKVVFAKILLELLSCMTYTVYSVASFTACISIIDKEFGAKDLYNCGNQFIRYNLTRYTPLLHSRNLTPLAYFKHNFDQTQISQI